MGVGAGVGGEGGTIVGREEAVRVGATAGVSVPAHAQRQRRRMVVANIAILFFEVTTLVMIFLLFFGEILIAFNGFSFD